MGDSSANPPPPPPPPPNTLVEPSKRRHKPAKVLRVFRNAFRSFPIIAPVSCKLPSLPGGRLPDGKPTRVTGTIFGYKKGRASLCIQENPRTLPRVVMELGMQTYVLQKELSLGMLRIAFECEKQAVKDKSELLEEPVWTMFSNGKKNGYSRRREATEEDLHVMEVLKAMSMGTGVLPPPSTELEGGDKEMMYMRWQFERVVGSKDSETLYMVSPNGGSINGPDLSIFFVRI